MGLLSTIGAASARAYGFTRSAVSAAVDAYFNRVTLLLNTSSTNGAQNNTFLDSSSNNFSITRNPTSGPNAPTQGTFTPFSQTGWSNYFDDSSIKTSTAAVALGTSEFSIEAFIYLIDDSGNGWTGNRTSAGSNEFSSRMTDTAISIGNSSSGTYNSQLATGTLSSMKNKWVHVAICRSSGTTSIFVDGTRQATTSTSINWSSSRNFAIGFDYSDTTTVNWTGYISNYRMVTGASAYNAGSSTITVPTSILSAITSTKILTSQSNRFVDNSGNSYEFTITGTPRVQAFSPFLPTAAYSTTTVGGSGYFDGTGDYLSSTPGAIGTSDFTMECWVYPLSTSQQAILDTRSTSNTNGTAIHINASNAFQMADGTSYIGTGTTAVRNQWTHLVMSRSGGNQRLFVNGVLSGSAVSNTTNYSTNSLKFGSDGNGSLNFNGYVSGVAFTIGSGVTSVTVPTSPPSPTGKNLCTNFTNAGIYDSASKNVLETVGNFQISTAQSKFGGSSMFASTGTSYALVSPSQNLEFGSGDFTIEFWWYPISTSRQALYHGSFGTDWSIGIDYSSLSTNQKLGIWASSNGTSWNLINADSGGNGIGTISLNQNAWNHVVYQRSGTTWSTYINGTRDLNLTSISGSIVNRASAQKAVGCWWSNSVTPAPQTGYIDDFRITKYARYSGATITVPTAAFPLQ
jgi:hypothetical protein